MGRIGEPKREIHIPVPPLPAPVEAPEPIGEPVEVPEPLEPVPAGTP
ncbi:MAG TPA: hypothetical protein VGN51_05255 [Acidimicrobiia bacterium]|jgi:hypothetical protein